MGRPKGSGKKNKSDQTESTNKESVAPQVAPETVYGTETKDTTIAPVPESGVPEIEVSLEVAQGDTVRYHSDLEPRLFKKGETIPAEWSDKNLWWKFDDRENKFTKIKG